MFAAAPAILLAAVETPPALLAGLRLPAPASRYGARLCRATVLSWASAPLYYFEGQRVRWYRRRPYPQTRMVLDHAPILNHISRMMFAAVPAILPAS